MGCSNSSSVAGSANDHCPGHFWDASQLKDLAGKPFPAVNIVEPALSFESMGTRGDIGVPNPCPPVAATHRRHVKRLHDFLKEVQDDPLALELEVGDRRRLETGLSKELETVEEGCGGDSQTTKASGGSAAMPSPQLSYGSSSREPMPRFQSL
mmetsp:Transcript_39685/g.91726  ORF Transcript_39685/g.91726 Transcript_39685/m.91726 type:complete len:153 (+) Transcript_39685:111-569(+)